ncbi:MAG: hypothetical protein U0P30_10165 [Vicinamibacterales bacterium]
MSVTSTVARVRETSTHADVMLHASPRIFRLARSHPRFDVLLRTLQDATASGAMLVAEVDDAGAVVDVTA